MARLNNTGGPPVKSKADKVDGIAIVGLLLIGVAIYLAWGLAAALAFAGVVLFIVGLTAAAIANQAAKNKTTR